MKDTGIIRRIDDLGRIVIPKEIRKSLKLKSGDPLEFYSESGALVLKKYSPLEKNEQFILSMVNAMTLVLERDCLITDLERVIYTSEKLKALENKKISAELLNIILEKKSIILTKNDGRTDFTRVFGEDFIESCALIVPIINEGKAFGAVIMTSSGDESSENSFDLKAVRVCVKLLSENIVSI